jgi:hypothetical protein
MRKFSFVECEIERGRYTSIVPTKLCFLDASEAGRSAGESLGRAWHATKEGVASGIKGTGEGAKAGAKGVSDGVGQARERDRQRRVERDMQVPIEKKREAMFSRLAEKTGLAVEDIQDALYVSGSVKSRNNTDKQAQIEALRKIIAHSDEVPHIEITFVGATDNLPPNFENTERVTDTELSSWQGLWRQILDERRTIGPDDIAAMIGNYRPVIERFIESDDPRGFIRSNRDAFTESSGLIQIARAYGRALNFRRAIFEKKADDGKAFPSKLTERIFLNLHPDALADFQRGGVLVNHDLRPDTAEEQRLALEEISSNPVRDLDTYAKSKGWKGLMVWPGKKYDYRDLAKYMNGIKLGIDAVDRQKDRRFQSVKGNLRIALNPEGVWNTVKHMVPDAWKSVVPRELWGKEMHDDKTTGAHFFSGFREGEGDIIAIDYDGDSTSVRDELVEGLSAYIAYKEAGGDEKPETRKKREELGAQVKMYLDNYDLLFPDGKYDAGKGSWERVLDACESPVLFAEAMRQHQQGFVLENLKAIRGLVYASYQERVTKYVGEWDGVIGDDGRDSGGYSKDQWENIMNGFKNPSTEAVRQASDIRFVLAWEKFIDGNLNGLKPLAPTVVAGSGKDGDGGKESSENFDGATRGQVETMCKSLEGKYKIPIILMGTFVEREYKYDYSSIMKHQKNLDDALKIITTKREDLLHTIRAVGGIMIAWETEFKRAEFTGKKTGWVETVARSANEPPRYRIVVDHTDSATEIAETIVDACKKSFSGDPEAFVRFWENRLRNDYHVNPVFDRGDLVDIVDDWSNVEQAFASLPNSTKEFFKAKKAKNEEITLFIYHSGLGSPATFEGRIGNNQIRIDADESVSGIQEDLISGAQDQKDHDESMWQTVKDSLKFFNWGQGEWKWPWSK